MKVLVIGSGGREHALVWELAQSMYVKKIWCAPGNGPGIGSEWMRSNCELVELVKIPSDDIFGLLSFAKKEKPDLTVVGPEDPLINGIVDEFEKENLIILGPTMEAAWLEGSKIFAKEIMWANFIPTAIGHICNNYNQALHFLDRYWHSEPCVVKADGPARGKGVYVCDNIDEAKIAAHKLMRERIFGASGDRVIIEKCLSGREISAHFLVDGEVFLPLAYSKDYKRLTSDSKSPNTGSMGSYSSALVTRKLHDKIQKKIVCPLVEAMAQRGTPYRGVLYAGLMITAAGSRYEYEEEPYVLEFNARFGDPEAQALLMRFKGDLFEPLYATATGQLATWIRGQGGLDAAMDSMWYDSHSISTTLASIGYPDAKDYKSKEIFGLDTIDALGDHVKVFHAGTRFGEGGKIFTNGGRVLSPTVLGTTHDMARILTEITIKKVNFEDMQFRDDIGL